MSLWGGVPRPPVSSPPMPRDSIFCPRRHAVEVGKCQQYIAKPLRISAEFMARQRRHGFSRDVGNVRIAHQHKAEDIRARLRNYGNPLRILERHGKDKVGLADGPLKRRLFSSGVSTQQREAGAVRGWKQLAERRLL